MRKTTMVSIAVAAMLLLVALPTGAWSPAEGGPNHDRIAELREMFAQVDSPTTTLGSSQGQSSNRPPRIRNLSLLGSSDLGGGGFNTDVWAHDKHAYSGTWGAFGFACPNDGTKVVDISDPSNPDLVGMLPAPGNTQTNDVKVASVNTRAFRGDLLVISNEDCAPGGARGFELWDVTDPTSAQFLGRFGPEVAFDVPPDLVDMGFGVHNTYIFEQGRRVYVATVVDFAEIFQIIFGAPLVGDLRIVDVTDPMNPTQVGDWGIVKNLGLDPFVGQGEDFALSFLHDVWIEKGVAYLSYWDAGLILLDVSDPSDPQFISRTPYAGDQEGNTHAGVPARGGNLVIVGDEDFTPGPWGFLRVFDTQDPTAPVEIATFATQNALNAPPPTGDFSVHNPIVRGNTVYTSWYSDGVQLVDISQPGAPRGIGSFVPPGVADPNGFFDPVPLVWGVYVHGDLILASDINGGLSVLKHVP